MVKPTFQTFENKIVYTWIGHSTAVISLGKNFNIIIDPVFADRDSPNQNVGPKRFRPPAYKIS
jgi:N-acyl-phosphatidylethanolamine-hydrolysing phospholipase D